MAKNGVGAQRAPPAARARAAAAARAAPTVTFYSLKPGKSVLRFVLLRPAEQDAVPSEHS